MRFLRVLLVIALLLAAAYAVLALLARPRPAHVYSQRLPQGTLVLAHQGGDGLWPSNTLTSFQGAAALGADVLELDVHLTADGHFVVLHDDTLDRTTDGTGPVAERNLSELQTLVEVLTAFPSYAVNVEIKQDDVEVARALCTELRDQAATERVMVGSFHADALRAFRAACPEVATSASPREVLTFFLLARARLQAVTSPPFEALQVPTEQSGLTVVTPHFVKAAHDRGVQVHVWTIDDVPKMERLVAMGVDGIITDRPDRALRVLGREVDPAMVPAFVAP